MALVIGGDAAGWDEGVIRGLFLVILAIIITVGTLAAPIESD